MREGDRVPKGHRRERRRKGRKRQGAVASLSEGWVGVGWEGGRMRAKWRSGKGEADAVRFDCGCGGCCRAGNFQNARLQHVVLHFVWNL